MKKNLLLAVCLLLTTGLFAQLSIEKGYFGGGVGFTKATGKAVDNASGGGGLCVYLDGGVYLSPKFAVGVEGNGNFHAFEDINDDLNFNAASLYLAKAEYFLLDAGFSPYVGLGLGVSTVESIFVDDTKFNFAVSPRAGIMAGGFQMQFTYSLAGKTPEYEFGSATVGGERYNFWAITVGYRYTIE